MKTKIHPEFRGAYKIFGETKQARIEIGSDCTIRLTVSKTHMVLPISIAVALGTREVQDFLADKSIGPYLFAQNERETREYAARCLLDREKVDARREFARACMDLGETESMAWTLARTKYP
jgi:hypothetical protein